LVVLHNHVHIIKQVSTGSDIVDADDILVPEGLQDGNLVKSSNRDTVVAFRFFNHGLFESHYRRGVVISGTKDHAVSSLAV